MPKSNKNKSMHETIMSLFYAPKIKSDELNPVTLADIHDVFYCSTKNLYDTWKI